MSGERQSVAIRTLSPADRDRWDDFVRGHQDGTFYHLSGWQSIFREQLGHATYYLYAESQGSIDGVLPLTRVRSWLFGDALISVPFLVYGGPLANSPQTMQRLIEAATNLADVLGVDYLELRNRTRTEPDWAWKESPGEIHRDFPYLLK